MTLRFLASKGAMAAIISLTSLKIEMTRCELVWDAFSACGEGALTERHDPNLTLASEFARSQQTD